MALVTVEELEAYLTAAELRRASDKKNIQVNTPLVENALEMASGTVLKYVQGTPGYPWATTPQEAKTCCFKIATYYIFQGVWGFVPADRKEAFNEAMQQLRDLAAGKTSWVAGQVPASQNAATVFYTNSVDRPRDGAPVRARRYFTDKL